MAGRPADARAAVAAGLRDLIGTDDVWFIGPLLWLGLRAEADARRPATERRTLLDRARAIVAAGEHGRFVPASPRRTRCCARRRRARGDPEPWQRAAEAWDALGHPFPAAYARWRQAEALLARRRAREGAEVLVAAHAAAQRLGAAPLARELARLAGRARVELGAAASRPRPPTRRAGSGSPAASARCSAWSPRA